MSRIIGIDLGTTNSCVAVMGHGGPKVIENAEGTRTTPSVVAYADEQVLVGVTAKRQSITNPENTLYGIKRLIGRRYKDREVQREKKLAPFAIIGHDNGDAWVEVRGQRIAPPEISARILDKMRQTVEDYLGERVTEAVITVPAYFNDSQRQATKTAGKIAGLEVKRIISEPTAAALAFGLDKERKKRKVAVYDLGGGTFDISIIEIAHLDGDIHFEVLSTNGDSFLGGEDFDQRIISHLVNVFKKEQGIDITDAMALQRLKDAAERAKMELSTSAQTEINLPFIAGDVHGPKHMAHKMTVDTVEHLVHDLAERTVSPCVTALRDAKLSQSDITDVILVGGMTRMPLIRRTVKKIFGVEPRRDVSPDESVAIGAAIQGAMLQRSVRDMVLLDVIPQSLGVSMHGYPPCTGPDPDMRNTSELVCRYCGAADEMATLIPKNTAIPTRANHTFTTIRDNQSSVLWHVLQGEQKLAKNNTVLGKFSLEDIPLAPRGEPSFMVTFAVDADGILHVTAIDQKTGKKTRIVVRSRSGLTGKEVQRIKQMIRHDTGRRT